MYRARQLSAEVAASGAACKVANVFAGLDEIACVVWEKADKGMARGHRQGQGITGMGGGEGAYTCQRRQKTGRRVPEATRTVRDAQTAPTLCVLGQRMLGQRKTASLHPTDKMPPDPEPIRAMPSKPLQSLPLQ